MSKRHRAEGEKPQRYRDETSQANSAAAVGHAPGLNEGLYTRSHVSQGIIEADADRDALIIELNAEGLSLPAIARVACMTKGGVRSALLRLGERHQRARPGRPSRKPVAVS